MHSPTPLYIHPDVAAVRSLYTDLFQPDYQTMPIREQLHLQAECMLKAFRSGNPATAVHLTCWHPRMIGMSAEEIMASQLTLDDARETLAREYGFTDWAEVERKGEAPPDPDFEAAVDALLEGRIDELKERLRTSASLAQSHSGFGHRATLLHYVGSNGIETHRQIVPANLTEAASLLLRSGADVDAPAEMYGGGTTTLALVTTSAHPHDAGVADQLIQLLIDAGARCDSGNEPN